MSESENPVSSDLLDLRLLPSWLKEESGSAHSYANYEGDDQPSRRDGRDDRRGSRPPQNRSQRDSRGPRRDGSLPDSRGSSGARPPQAESRRSDSRDRRGESRNQRHFPVAQRGGDRPMRQEEDSAPVEIHFLPEALALEKVTEQLQSAPIAYPLFAVAKMFLQRPERHEVHIKPLPGGKLYRLLGTQHLSTDRGRL